MNEYGFIDYAAGGYAESGLLGLGARRHLPKDHICAVDCYCVSGIRATAANEPRRVYVTREKGDDLPFAFRSVLTADNDGSWHTSSIVWDSDLFVNFP